MPGRASTPVKKVFGAPYMGISHALPEHSISENALWAAFNCVYTKGRVATRQSMVKLTVVKPAANAPAFASRVLGAWSNTTSANNFDIYATTPTKIWRLRDFTGAWTDVTGSLTLTHTAVHTPRWASLYNQADGKTVTIMVNRVDDAVKSLDGAAFTTLVVGGEKAVDICTSASRFVAIINPYRVRWSDIYSSTFPALNFYTAQDTPGAVVAIRNLGTLGVCIYKEDAIVVGYSQPGSAANAFRFETRIELPGPAGASAVVQAEGKHFLMTRRGRIGVFDGTRFEWIGDGIWDFLLRDFDYNYAYQTHGFYDETEGQVWFVYPRIGSGGAGPVGIAIITLPRPAWGIPSYGVWAGEFKAAVSCSNTLRLTSGYGGLVFRADAGSENAELVTNPLDYSSFGDDEIDFDCFLQTGLQSLGSDIIKVELEALLQRGADFGVCTVQPMISYTLGVEGGFAGVAQTIDLEATEPVHAVFGGQVAGRFVGLKVSWQSRVPEAEAGDEEGGVVYYKGAIIYGHPLEYT